MNIRDAVDAMLAAEWERYAETNIAPEPRGIVADVISYYDAAEQRHCASVLFRMHGVQERRPRQGMFTLQKVQCHRATLGIANPEFSSWDPAHARPLYYQMGATICLHVMGGNNRYGCVASAPACIGPGACVMDHFVYRTGDDNRALFLQWLPHDSYEDSGEAFSPLPALFFNKK